MVNILKRAEKNQKNLYNDIAIGATAGFIGQYIGDVLYNAIENKGYFWEIRSEDSLYIAGVVSGGAVAIFNEKLSLFSSVVLSVGLFYLVFDASDQLLGGKGMREANLIREFIFDVIIIYILVAFQNKFIELFFPHLNENSDNLFADEVIVTLVTGIIINAYYDIKNIIRQKNK